MCSSRGLLCCRIQTEAITFAACLASYSPQRQRGARPCRAGPGTRLVAKAPRNTLRAPGTASYGAAAARAAAIALGKEQLHLPRVWLILTRKRPVCACHRRAHLSRRHPASCRRQAEKPGRANVLPITRLHPAMPERHFSHAVQWLYTSAHIQTEQMHASDPMWNRLNRFKTLARKGQSSGMPTQQGRHGAHPN